MLKQRLITALFGIPVISAVIWFEGPLPWFTILAAVWSVLAVYEFYRIVGVSRILPLVCFGLVWSLFFIISPHFDYALLLPLLLTTAIALPAILVVFLPRKQDALHNWAWTIAGILYVGWLASYLVGIRLEAGRNWLFFVFFVTFASDSAAYFTGRLCGRHRLAPLVSPKKTWEGAVGGIVGAVIVSLLFTLPTPLQVVMGYGQVVLLGLLVSVFGQIGDLTESLLKRNMSVKDSGRMVPGHGGLLDRMDSLIFAGIVVYYYLLVCHGGVL